MIFLILEKGRLLQKRRLRLSINQKGQENGKEGCARGTQEKSEAKRS